MDVAETAPICTRMSTLPYLDYRNPSSFYCGLVFGTENVSLLRSCYGRLGTSACSNFGLGNSSRVRTHDLGLKY